MFETLATQVDAILDQLTLLVDRNAFTSITPLLLVHPPDQRNAHASFLRNQQDIIDLLLTTILFLEQKILSLREKTYRQQRACSLAQAPISALPNELLCSIFSFAVGSSQYGEPEIETHRKPLSIATAISKVCRKWHLTAMSLPILWTDIHMSERSLARADETFRRSVTEPISLHISDNTQAPISESLGGELHGRLRRLTLNSYNPAATFEDLAKVVDDDDDEDQEYAALEYLQLSERSFSDEGHVFRSLISLPKLRSLRLDGLFISYNLRAEHLDTLVLSRQSERSFGRDFCRFLHSHPQLRMVVLDSIDICTQWTEFTPAVLEDLHHLEIRNGSRKSFLGILQCFSAPHLETFITDEPDIGDDGGDSDDEEDLGEDIMSLRAHFRRALGQLFMTSDSLNQISVTAGPDVSRDLLLALKRRMPADSFAECRVPNLKELHIKLPRYREFQFPELKALAKALSLTLARRANLGSHLDRLVVSECLKREIFWEEYIPEEIAKKTVTEPCLCDAHSLVSSSDDGRS